MTPESTLITLAHQQHLVVARAQLLDIGVTATDMDSSTGLVQKVTVGSTDIVIGETDR